jgi:hypothetical protein
MYSDVFSDTLLNNIFNYIQNDLPFDDISSNTFEYTFMTTDINPTRLFPMYRRIIPDISSNSNVTVHDSHEDEDDIDEDIEARMVSVNDNNNNNVNGNNSNDDNNEDEEEVAEARRR